MAKLSKEEADIARSYELGEWKPVKNRSAEIRRYQAYARETLRKRRRVNIRISPQDLAGVQRKALAEGIPYPTLLASIIHKFVTGKFVEKGNTGTKYIYDQPRRQALLQRPRRQDG